MGALRGSLRAARSRDRDPGFPRGDVRRVRGGGGGGLAGEGTASRRSRPELWPSGGARPGVSRVGPGPGGEEGGGGALRDPPLRGRAGRCPPQDVGVGTARAAAVSGTLCPMKKHNLGQSGIEVSTIGLGCMSLSSMYGRADPAQARATLLRALELGVNFFDTANVYGQGHNERFLGEVLGAHRESFVLASKFGIVWDGAGGPGVNGRPEAAARCCDESLTRLGCDVIDLYYLHRADPEVPIEETVGAMAELIKAGKVRSLGLSEVNSQTLRRAHAVHPIAAVQSEYSLWTRDPEAGLLASCEALGTTFVAFSPLGRGMLTGALESPDQLSDKDTRRRIPRFDKEHFARNRSLVQAFCERATARGCTPGQLALAWVLAHDNTVTIPGTKHVGRLEENLGAAALVLEADEVEELAALFPAGDVSGDRYPPALMRTVQSETGERD